MFIFILMENINLTVFQGKGDINNCVDSNQFCYVCEPPSEGTSLSDFEIFPEPEHSSTWVEATKKVEAHADSTNPPKWSYDMVVHAAVYVAILIATCTLSQAV